MNVVALIAAIAALAASTPSAAFEWGEFPGPSLEGYELERIKHIDKNEERDGEQETLVEIFNDGEDHYVLRYTTNGVVWAWGIIGDHESGPENTTSNFAIRDSNGDGKFDQRYVGTEEFFLPAWVYNVQGV